jgi:hypothetical protein
MIIFSGKITKNYAWELSSFYKNRKFGDGITFFECNINWDRYLADHTPKFNINIVVLNIQLIDFSIYYIWHRDELYDPILKNYMNNHPTLFDVSQYEIKPSTITDLFRKVASVPNLNVDIVQEFATMYGVNCETVIKIYQIVTNEQLSNNSKD